MGAAPADLRARLEAAYAGELFYEALRVVEALDATPRVQRAVVFLAGGDLDELRRFARVASRDWRDVVFWAEYADHDAPEPRKVRSMEEPFGDA